MQTVSSEVKEIFSDPEFEKTLKVLASELGEETTLKSLYFWYQQNKQMPTKVINGAIYEAGYSGGHMVTEGHHRGELLDIKEYGQTCKLTFGINDKRVYLYHNFPKDDLKIEQFIKLSKSVGDFFPVVVKHETIPTTGDKHAVVAEVMGLKELLKDK